MNGIARFEALAERLVEGTFARLFAGRLSPLEVATSLARVMEDHQVTNTDGTLQVPNHYWVYMHPENYRSLTAERPTLEKELARSVAELMAQAGLKPEADPIIRVLPDEAVGLHQVRVAAAHPREEPPVVEETREMESEDIEATSGETVVPPVRPFLILEGRRHFNLLQPVVSIGRALDNDVIIEDPRVSRHHAQLRRRYGHYVLYDLGSAGGTQINGYPIEECVLHSGDVISFAGVQVVYGEDPPTPIPVSGSDNTPSLAPSEHETG